MEREVVEAREKYIVDGTYVQIKMIIFFDEHLLENVQLLKL